MACGNIQIQVLQNIIQLLLMLTPTRQLIVWYG